MNSLRFKQWLSRQQVLVTVLIAGAVIFGLLYFLLTFFNRDGKRLEKEIGDMRDLLARKGYLVGVNALEERKNDELLRYRRLRDEWKSTEARVAAFPRTDQSGGVGHIDFKIALREVRQRLETKSKSLHVGLPRDLGIDDSIRSDENSRKLMIQLRSVEKIVDNTLDLKLSALRTVVPLQPVEHKLANGTPFMEEYPVHLECYGTMENVYDLLESVMRTRSFFALKSVRIEPAPPDRQDQLAVTLVVSALIFTREPDDLPVTLQQSGKKSAPMGH